MGFTVKCGRRCGLSRIPLTLGESHRRSRKVYLQTQHMHAHWIILTPLKGLTVEFLCVFGISSAVPGLDIGEQVACFHDGFTIMTYQGLGGQVYWFIVQKLDRKYTYPYHPSFSKQDAVDVCERLGNVWLRDTVHFRHVWANRETFAVTPLEEGIVRPWHSGRMVCIGDSIHKVKFTQTLCIPRRCAD